MRCYYDKWKPEEFKKGILWLSLVLLEILFGDSWYYWEGLRRAVTPANTPDLNMKTWLQSWRKPHLPHRECIHYIHIFKRRRVEETHLFLLLLLCCRRRNIPLLLLLYWVGKCCSLSFLAGKMRIHLNGELKQWKEEEELDFGWGISRFLSFSAGK